MYLNFYNLKVEPFRLTPDPKFLQLPEPHRNALMALAQGVARKDGLMLFSGPVGTGKTTVLNGLLNVLGSTFPEKTFHTALILNPRLDREELLETLLLEFEVTSASTSKPSRIAALQGLLFGAARSGGTCLLIIDEAHLLTPDVLEEVRLLMNADSHREKLLQVILCGQPELAELVRDPACRAVRQRIAVRATLRELSLSETMLYVAERLRIAGLTTESPFTSEAVHKVYEYTGGVPRLINILCDAALGIGCETSRARIADDVIEEAAVRHEFEICLNAGKEASMPALSQNPTPQPVSVAIRSEL